MLSGALCRLGPADAGAERNFAAIASSLPDEYGFVDEHQEEELAYLVKVARALVPHAAVSREQVVALASEPTWLSELDKD